MNDTSFIPFLAIGGIWHSASNLWLRYRHRIAHLRPLLLQRLVRRCSAGISPRALSITIPEVSPSMPQFETSSW
jgi:hypothetical protein